MTFSICRCLVVGALLFSFATLYAEDTAAVLDRLHRADAVNSLDDVTLKPWHLKLSFQLFDTKGKPAEQGTMEEWWAGPDKDKRVFVSPSYKATEIRTKDGLYRTAGAGPASELVEIARQQAVDPMPRKSDEIGIKPELRKKSFGNVQMDCIMLSLPMKNAGVLPLGPPPLGFFPTYCLGRDQNALRVSFDFGSLLMIRNNIGLFQKRLVAIAITAKLNNITTLSAHIDKLETFTPSDTDFAPGPELEKVPSVIKVGSAVAAGKRVGGPPPHYPERAKERHATGSVVMRCLIGTDGHIYNLKLVSVPDQDLAIAALTAVRQWTYHPYLLNGKPVPVDTTITVNFAMGTR